jgi:hydroxyacylglutathione hydrolase
MHSDNYSYLLICEASGACAAVDPAEPSKALAAAEAAGVVISVVLTTHKHWDHAGGNVALAEAIPGEKGLNITCDFLCTKKIH